MCKLLENKTVMVTGSNRGIGRAIVEKFAEHGATIFACARKLSDTFEEDMRQLEQKYNVRIICVYFDLSSSEEMKQAVMEIRHHKLPVDVLVNCAGILSEYRNFTMMSMDNVKRTFDIDFFAQMELTQYVARLMQRNRKGSIIYISSIAAIDGFFSSYDYVASKAAIHAAMKQQARELGQTGIRVNAVAPGIVRTDMIKDSNEDNLEIIENAIMLKRFGTPEEIANAVLFLGSELSSYVTGQVLRVDGGTNPPKAVW